MGSEGNGLRVPFPHLRLPLQSNWNSRWDGLRGLLGGLAEPTPYRTKCIWEGAK
jgi:hypothetical protein